MTSATDVLAELQALGVTVRVVGDRVRLRPSTAIPPDLIERARAVKPALLALLAPPLDVGLAVREVLMYPAVLLGELPLPTTLVLAVLGVPGRPVTIATHAECGPADFDAAEWLAMVATTSPWPAELGIAARRKRTTPTWRFAAPEQTPDRTRTVAAVLGAFGATLRAVVIDGGQP